ncbi:ImmA/IrrE family metallo-endopeptidase [Iamia sp.]|uniref:ImmA/IrrE family metallo-endopeptidase n=1 Tax=Iamia sp. TaxID=2722710 RepID=UPI002C04C9A0|nr:ImmA/IrrE family metallo-endopeptidase [Iamia sp.]HXH58429.1 ImmA/IrrE family metallo-endopeptidase [Iamia sp.]
MAGVAERWNPWRALRENEHLSLVFADLGEGRGRIEDHGDGTRTIYLDASLSRTERSAVLGHEVVHGELDLLWTDDTPDHVVSRGERRVDQIVAERLVPADELAALIDRLVGIDVGVSSAEVAEHFDVPELVARRALQFFRGA